MALIELITHVSVPSRLTRELESTRCQVSELKETIKELGYQLENARRAV